MRYGRVMAHMETLDDLARLAPSLLRSGVDVGRLLRRPGILSPELKAALDRAGGMPIKLSPAERARRLAGLRAHPVRFGRLPPEGLARIDLPPGEYDLTVAFRLPLVDETIAG